MDPFSLNLTIKGNPRPQGRGRAMAMWSKGRKERKSQALDLLQLARAGGRPLGSDDLAAIQTALDEEPRAHVYDAPDDRDWKNTLRWEFLPHALVPLWEGPVILTAKFVFALPKSRPHWMHDLVASGAEVFALAEGDTENLIRPLKDAAKGILWVDDRQVGRDTVTKVYGPAPCLELHLEFLPAPVRIPGPKNGTRPSPQMDLV